MKKIILILVIALSFTTFSKAQDATMTAATPAIISLSQSPGEFDQKTMTVNEGTYVFEITNNQAGTDVGFVLVPKGKDVSKAENHIKTAYVTTVVKEGKTERSNTTTLTKGEYVYFCPLNKTTTDNTLIVQ